MSLKKHPFSAALITCVQLLYHASHAASIQFVKNATGEHEYGYQSALPPTFGQGEFTFEVWVKPDTSFPIGLTNGGENELTNWGSLDPEPNSSQYWWKEGNWLLDGHSRDDAGGRPGTFALQFHAGGRVRWYFADNRSDKPLGMVQVIQEYPASNTPSLLDGNWHQITCVRRWNAGGGADLELWIDGKTIAVDSTPVQEDMRDWWDEWPGFMEEHKGWTWGAEEMSATHYTQYNITWTQFEDYKGLVDEIRFWDRSKTPDEIENNWDKPVSGNELGLVGYLPLDEGVGDSIADVITPASSMSLHKMADTNWSTENAPMDTSGTPARFLNQHEADIMIVPPVIKNSRLHLNLKLASGGRVQMSLYALHTGQRLFNTSKTFSQGIHSEIFAAGIIARGVHLLELKKGKIKLVRRVIVL